ncbi:hypothetical protein PI124_g11017 [Phytophthora idaei]|nr:hypothetical protein PI125_g14433 [Phytophthora idaei]KAG3244203.1 hypothetical protein PI124_g11017 [Phytophthora idaei]
MLGESRDNREVNYQRPDAGGHLAGFCGGLRTVATRPHGGRKAAFDVASIARSRFSTELCAQLRPPSRRTEILPVERSPDRKRSNLRWGRGLQGGCMYCTFRNRTDPLGAERWNSQLW